MTDSPPSEAGYGEKERIRRWRLAHPEKVRENASRKRKQRLEQMHKTRDGSVLSRQEIWEREKGVCGICGEVAESDSWELDHIVPLAQGGSHTLSNLQVAHPRCNRTKGGSMRVRNSP